MSSGLSDHDERQFAGFLLLIVIAWLVFCTAIVQDSNGASYMKSAFVVILSHIIFIVSVYLFSEVLLPALGYLVVDLPYDIRDWLE